MNGKDPIFNDPITVFPANCRKFNVSSQNLGSFAKWVFKFCCRYSSIGENRSDVVDLRQRWAVENWGQNSRTDENFNCNRLHANTGCRDGLKKSRNLA